MLLFITDLDEVIDAGLGRDMSDISPEEMVRLFKVNSYNIFRLCTH